jgi:hypothetical protein
MYARVRSYRIKQGQVDERLRHARNTSFDAYKGQKGFRGVLILVDPIEHKNMTVGLWETEADMLASEQAEESASKSSHRHFAAGDVSTEHFEVKSQAGEVGDFARVITSQINPGQIEQRLRHSRGVVAPYWSSVPGHRGHILLIEEASHKNLTIGFFDTEANMLASLANAQSQAILAARPVTGPDTIEHFQVAHAE